MGALSVVVTANAQVFEPQAARNILIGSVAGAIIGENNDKPLEGALIGAAAGALWSAATANPSQPAYAPPVPAVRSVCVPAPRPVVVVAPVCPPVPKVVKVVRPRVVHPRPVIVVNPAHHHHHHHYAHGHSHKHGKHTVYSRGGYGHGR
jgi:ABC-type nickel/cobalt efflux system permease component RcnA